MRHFKLNPSAALLASISMILVGGSSLQAADLDHKIEHSAKTSYNFKTYLKDDNIKVESSAGVVTLSGSTATEYHKFLAQETVAALSGVKGVNNNLSVVANQPKDQSDGWITAKVKAILAFHKNVSASDTEVNTQGGVVTLTGKAGTEAQKQLTAEYAKDVEGVSSVRNNLVVAKGAHRTLGDKVDDTSITAQVKSALLFHKSTHMLATKVTTKNGVVTLHGEAKNPAERTLVTKLAEDVHGVKRVSNKMTVK